MRPFKIIADRRIYLDDLYTIDMDRVRGIEYPGIIRKEINSKTTSETAINCYDTLIRHGYLKKDDVFINLSKKESERLHFLMKKLEWSNDDFYSSSPKKDVILTKKVVGMFREANALILKIRGTDKER